MSPANINNCFIFILLTLLYLTTFPSFTEALNCTSTDIICVPAYKYNINWVRFNIITTKECDICVGFTCLIDQEKVAVGMGCAEDFEKYCPNATFKVNLGKASSSNNLQSDYEYSVLSCNRFDNCNDRFFNVMQLPNDGSGNLSVFGNGLIFGKKFKEIDTCTPKSTVSDNGLMNKINSFKLFGMIVIGWILVKFW